MVSEPGSCTWILVIILYSVFLNCVYHGHLSIHPSHYGECIIHIFEPSRGRSCGFPRLGMKRRQPISASDNVTLPMGGIDKVEPVLVSKARCLESSRTCRALCAFIGFRAFSFVSTRVRRSLASSEHRLRHGKIFPLIGGWEEMHEVCSRHLTYPSPFLGDSFKSSPPATLS